MFRFTGKLSSGSHSQYLAKITHLVKSRYGEAVQDVVSVMATYSIYIVLLQSQYAAITLTKSCRASTFLLL